ncbi:hypothetical protein RJG79_07050 [Mycoplasmatota bacterium WC44]
MKLYHISDNEFIKEFETRKANQAWPNLNKEYVWAISSEMVHNYYFPRNCPRVCWMIGPNTNINDKDYISSLGDYRGVIFTEKSWEEEIHKTKMYRYRFDTSSFYPVDYDAGYYVSERVETPINLEIISNLLDELRESRIKVVFVDDLAEYQKQSIERSFRFSNIRMNYKNKK